jgi:hypothetical protein
MGKMRSPSLSAPPTTPGITRSERAVVTQKKSGQSKKANGVTITASVRLSNGLTGYITE